MKALCKSNGTFKGIIPDEDTYKVLKCCTTKDMSCKECPAFTPVNRSNCKKYLKATVDLIDRQKAEIDRLNALLEIRHKIFETKCSELEIAKTEAYKEFAERLCDGKVSNDKTVIEAEVLLKEMVGEQR